VVWDHTGQQGEPGEILDVSPAGLFLAALEAELPRELKMGDLVWGQFDVLEEEFPFSAIVRWRGLSPVHQREGVGLEFTDLSQIPTELLSAFISAHSISPETS